jgi:hypothetical protein
MRQRSLDLVFLGLSLSSSWGNGHATTYRALLRGLAERGHRLLFLERDVPWYAAARDLPRPGFCDLELYDDVADLPVCFGERIAAADAVIVGSYVPDGIAVIDRVNGIVRGAGLPNQRYHTPATAGRRRRSAATAVFALYQGSLPLTHGASATRR